MVYHVLSVLGVEHDGAVIARHGIGDFNRISTRDVRGCNHTGADKSNGDKCTEKNAEQPAFAHGTRSLHRDIHIHGNRG